MARSGMFVDDDGPAMSEELAEPSPVGEILPRDLLMILIACGNGLIFPPEGRTGMRALETVDIVGMGLVGKEDCVICKVCNASYEMLAHLYTVPKS